MVEVVTSVEKVVGGDVAGLAGPALEVATATDDASLGQDVPGADEVRPPAICWRWPRRALGASNSEDEEGGGEDRVLVTPMPSWEEAPVLVSCPRPVPLPLRWWWDGILGSVS